MKPIVAILALTVLLLLASNANANGKHPPAPPPQQQDSGIYFTNDDKSEHAVFGVLLGFAGRLQFRENRWHALAVPAGVSVLKELADSTDRGNHFSGKDIAYGIAGGILGMVVADGAIYLTRRSGTTTVMLSMPVKVLE